MRKLVCIIVAAWLVLALSPSIWGQNPPPSNQQPTQKTPPPPAPAQPTPPADTSAQADPPTSLGDLARMARANKKADSKATKVLDDDNFPRSKRPPEPAPSGTTQTTAPGSAPSSSASSFASGKLVLLDFWASWCGPCRSALPGLKRLQSFYGSDQLQVISISADDDEDDWRAFVKAHNMNWEQRLDSNGSLRAQYGVNAFPTYILLGKDGKILERLEGEDPEESIAERLGPTLREHLQRSQ